MNHMKHSGGTVAGSVISIPFEPGKVPAGFGEQVEYECGGGGVEVWVEIKRSPVSETN